ncbi:MAG TPA: CFI-box-CTERM domain-containing protein [Polyangiales bacterium]|nr:CFI-box-CTERM domain-containing protein [Polyangiales bacterium]
MLAQSKRALVCLLLLAAAGRADAEDARLLELRYTPVARAQVAIWMEDGTGRFLATLALTEAVAYRGIGNRPGASQMNSGYRWPYGRREGVLPIWAHRRAAAPGAALFPRVIYQSRREGYASRITNDQSPDDYYCLQFDPTHSKRDQLDAISCATMFSSDKGRYLTEADVRANYVEPWEEPDQAAMMQRLPMQSLYPPRMDAVRCITPECFDSLDVERYAADARQVMPEIDAVTRATAPGDAPQTLLFNVPSAWPAGDYVALIEVNVEGDYNEHWSSAAYATPELPDGAWDSFAVDYGYPYRGQPSIVYALPFRLGDPSRTSFSATAPVGRSSWEHWSGDYGKLEPVSVAGGDPNGMADRDGSGADRLRRDATGARFALQVKTVAGGDGRLGEVGVAGRPGELAQPPVGAVEQLALRPHPNPLRSHTWVLLDFLAARSERAIHAYDVRVATEPIADEATFILNGRPAKNATDDAEGATALVVPVAAPGGTFVEVAIGDLVAQTHYYVAVRATDELNRSGPIRVAEIDTTARSFATVSACFIASAAYGTPLASEVGVLRRLRDRYLSSIAPGRAVVAAYYRIGKRAAAIVDRRPQLRGLVRACLSPLVAATSWLTR